MIESIQIKNFRGIQQGQIEQFRKFNLLVGPNNSGKTAILEALYLSSTTDRLLEIPEQANSIKARIPNVDLLGYQSVNRVLSRHNYEPLDSLTNKYPKELFGYTHPQPATSTFSLPPVVSQLLPQPKSAQEEIPFTFGIRAEETPYYRNIVERLFGGSVSASESNNLIFCAAQNLSYQSSEEAGWVIAGKLPASKHTLLYDVQMMLGHLPMSFFREMIRTVPGWSQKISERFGKVFDIAQSFNVQFLPADKEQKWTQGWIAPADRVALTIDSYGDGARSAFKVLTPLLALRELVREDTPGLFLWEEPELFQNPQTLIRLLTEVAELLKGKPIQVFIATHSLEVIANFTALAQGGKIEPDELRAFRLDLKEGQLKSSWFSADNLQAWTETGLDPRVWGDFQSPLQCSLRKETPDEQEEAA